MLIYMLLTYARLRLSPPCTGCEMKATIEVQMEQARQKKREYVAAAHNTVFDARKKKQGAARARAQYKIENAELIKEAARKEVSAQQALSGFFLLCPQGGPASTTPPTAASPKSACARCTGQCGHQPPPLLCSRECSY